jgi:hypothetical protein
MLWKIEKIVQFTKYLKLVTIWCFSKKGKICFLVITYFGINDLKMWLDSDKSFWQMEINVQSYIWVKV